MKAGRELDALVAEKVMGIELCHHELDKKYLVCKRCHVSYGFWKPKWGTIEPPSYYSINIAAAWSLHLAICGGSFTERHDYLLALGPTICERLRKEAVPPLGEHESIDWPWVLSGLEPVDICLAALKAKEIDIDT